MNPSLFVSHGAPTLPLDPMPARDFLVGLGKTLERPKGIVIATAHWETRAPAVAKMAVNDTVHDFRGFPQALYELRYPAPGDAALSDRVAALTGASVEARGLDHGAWVPLLLMYPQHDIPVVQIAVQPHLGVAHHIALGRALSPLREDGVLVMGSGSFVHNLRQLDWQGGYDAPEPDWSKAFAGWMDAAIMARDDAALIDYRERAPFAQMAHPEDEHLLPLFVAYGAGGAATKLHDSRTFGSLRMDAYGFA